MPKMIIPRSSSNSPIVIAKDVPVGDIFTTVNDGDHAYHLRGNNCIFHFNGFQVTGDQSSNYDKRIGRFHNHGIAGEFTERGNYSNSNWNPIPAWNDKVKNVYRVIGFEGITGASKKQNKVPDACKMQLGELFQYEDGNVAIYGFDCIFNISGPNDLCWSHRIYHNANRSRTTEWIAKSWSSGVETEAYTKKVAYNFGIINVSSKISPESNVLILI